MKYIRWFFAMSVILLLSAGCNNQSSQSSESVKVAKLDLSKYSDKKPAKKLNLLFIHHSCGATLMAMPGEKKENIVCIHHIRMAVGYGKF